MTSIEEKKNSIVAKLVRLADRPNDRYQYLIDLGRKLEPMDAKLQMDAFLVSGCLSKVWLVPSLSADGQVVHFEADADAQIPKGIVALVLAVYNDCSPQEILTLDPSFLDPLGLGASLSMNRRNSIGHFIQAIRNAAQGFLSC